MQKTETLKEKWVSFVRMQCLDGFIDVWMGDSSANPNRETPPEIFTNGFSEFVRLNGEMPWISIDYGKGVKSFILENSEVFTSDEIWDELKKYIT